MRPEERRRHHLGSAANILAALLVLVPLVDYVANVWPVRPSEIGWRYAAEGLWAGFLLTPCLGLALAVGVAVWRAHAGTLRVLAAVMILAAVALVPLGIDFVLSAAQLRHSAPPEALARFQAGAIKVTIQYLLVIAGLAAAGVAVTRAARLVRDAHGEPPQILTPPRSRSV
jgi:hypothetical protein